MRQIFNKQWFEASTVRAIKTFAQSMIGTIGGAVLFTEIDWRVVVSSALIALITSYLTSLAGLPEVTDIE